MKQIYVRGNKPGAVLPALCLATAWGTTSLTPHLMPQVQADTPAQARYSIHHGLTIKDIPQGSKKVRIWFWMPSEDSAQKILDFAVTQAPAGYKITRDPAYGQQYLYCEVSNPTQNSLSVATNFILQRNAISIGLDPDKSGPLTALHRITFADHLREDTPNMMVDAQIQALTAQIVGGETNVIRRARKIYDYVIEKAEHYSKGETAPKPSKIGSVEYCRTNGGGSCTDMHALFSSLARANGIPTRLYFGSRLQAKNEGKDVDPGYRCSVEFFAPNYGWIPLDVAAGDTNPDKKDFYFGGLDERRVLFNEGRDLDLSPKQEGGRINLVIGAYVEVDGKAHTAWERSMRFTEIKQATRSAQLVETAADKDRKP